MNDDGSQNGRQLPHLLGTLMGGAWRLLRSALVAALNVLLALVLLFEEWGWQPLAAAIAWFARFRLVARAEELIARLPPYPSLAVFALPTAILFPVKVGALWLLAGGHVIKASMLLVAAKVASTALVARIFMLTKPALMEITWFRRGYEWFMPWKEELFARVRASFAWRYGRMLKSRARQLVRRASARWKPYIVTAYRSFRQRLTAILQRYFGKSV